MHRVRGGDGGGRVDRRHGRRHPLGNRRREEFVPDGALQAEYPGQPWIFDWTVRGSNCSALVFEWRRHGADELTRRVVLRNDPSLRRVGGVPSKRRSCTLPWTSSEAPRGAQPSPPRAQPSPHHGTQLTILSDTWRAYDWMRYDFTVWAEAVSARLMHLGPPAPLVIIDPMCGGGCAPRTT
jgi:hypothetical protein